MILGEMGAAIVSKIQESGPRVRGVGHLRKRRSDASGAPVPQGVRQLLLSAFLVVVRWGPAGFGPALRFRAETAIGRRLRSQLLASL